MGALSEGAVVILTGPEIREQIELGNIEIDPYVPEHVNPASVDLTLGNVAVVYVSHAMGRELSSNEIILNSKIENETKKFSFNEIVLRPGELYLMHTVERVRATRFVSIVDGKSSLGRLGVSVHQTAGYGDPGFNGQYTLEVTCVLPVRLYAGMRVAQMRFHAVQGEVEEYRGNYVGEAARGPVASRSWRQFK